MVQLFRYPAAQVKPDTGGFLTRPAVVPGEALLKDPGKILFPDTDAGICDDQSFAIPIDADSSSGRGVFQRVGEMVSYNDLALAAVGIVLKVERFPLNVGIGICQGMMPLVAYNYSAGNERRMEDTIRLARRLGLIVAVVSIALYELFAVQFAHLFISDTQTVALASEFLRIRVLATPLMFLSFFTVYVFQAFGRGRISLFLGVTRWLVFNIPMLLLLNAVIGMYGIVWSQVTADTLTVILSFYVYRKYRPAVEGRKETDGKG